MAAVTGRRFSLRQIKPRKSIGGSVSFFLFTLLASAIYLFNEATDLSTRTIIFYATGTASIGVLIELFSQKNLDNLTVPIILGVIGFLIGI